MTARFAYASILVLGFLAMTSKGQSPMSFAPPACQSLSSQLNLTDLAFDLDQDGDLDLLARNAGSVQLVPLRNDGPGVWTPLSPINLTQLPDSIRAGDLDGDGDPDLAMTRFDGNIGLLFQQTGAWTQVLFATGGVPGNGLQLVDWEGDGDLDILANRTHLHVNNGSGGFAPPQPIASFANPTLSHLESADLDGDGDSDHVSLTTDAQGRSVLRVHRKGPTGLTTQLVMSRTLAIQGLAIGDLDGDGLKDIAVLNTSVDHFPVNFQLRPYLQRSGFRF
ncbi:MAG: VCBS repeat-containing protein, partial [Planctomycetes bacterium]|nr:VCBS repeat-containing protein [Planctomycetota bacterium]